MTYQVPNTIAILVALLRSQRLWMDPKRVSIRKESSQRMSEISSQVKGYIGNDALRGREGDLGQTVCFSTQRACLHWCPVSGHRPDGHCKLSMTREGRRERGKDVPAPSSFLWAPHLLRRSGSRLSFWWPPLVLPFRSVTCPCQMVAPACPPIRMFTFFPILFYSIGHSSGRQWGP